ncbi:MAG: hypothetical protein QOI71_294, partial [Gaiellales bacterium]|nr:hypothetical protein [Gaiellales bacterium]
RDAGRHHRAGVGVGRRCGEGEGEGAPDAQHPPEDHRPPPRRPHADLRPRNLERQPRPLRTHLAPRPQDRWARLGLPRARRRSRARAPLRRHGREREGRNNSRDQNGTRPASKGYTGHRIQRPLLFVAPEAATTRADDLRRCADQTAWQPRRRTTPACGWRTGRRSGPRALRAPPRATRNRCCFCSARPRVPARVFIVSFADVSS